MRNTTRSPLLTAFFHPLNLAMLMLIAAAGLCSAWWLFPLGLLFWLVMFLNVYRNPALHFINRIAARQPLARRFQPRFERVQAAQVSLFRTLQESRAKTRRLLEPVQAAVNRAAEQSYRLSQRMSVVENHILVARAYQNPEADLNELDKKIADASDAAIRQDYLEARRALEKKVAELKTMAAMLERFDVQLTTLANVLEGAVTSAVRLQALKEADARQEVKPLLSAIQEQALQLDEFERELAAYAGLPAANANDLPSDSTAQTS